jgi:cytochrome c peroxidase
MVFKVASLRNVEKTAPYFHDGAVADLAEAVTWMGRHQFGRELTPKEVRSIVAYLKTLTGTIPEEYIARPAN